MNEIARQPAHAAQIFASAHQHRGYRPVIEKRTVDGGGAQFEVRGAPPRERERDRGADAPHTSSEGRAVGRARV